MTDNDKCPTCGSTDPTDRPIVRRHDLHERQGNYLEPAHTPCPDPFHDPAPERPDKCPTCGSADPAEYASPCDRALYSDDRSDPFHRSHEGVPSRVGFHGNVVAPKPQGLDAVSGDGTWDEADERYAAAMSDERPDKCPTCGIAREHDGPHYYEALKQAGKPMCPDPFHDPAPTPEASEGEARRWTLDRCPDCSDSDHSHKFDSPVEVVEAAPLDAELTRLRRRVTTLREAVEACAEALGAWEMSSKPSDPTIAQGLLRAGDKARRALASLDEQGGSDD